MRALALTILLVNAHAAAQGDGVYGRLAGDVTVEALAGGGVAFEPRVTTGSVALELRARYLGSAGVLVGGELRPDGASRVLFGIDLRPIFLPRFLLGGSFRDRYWDLWLDSIGLDLGLAITPLDQGAGVALAVGLGFDVPLFFFDEGLSGLALRISARHVAGQATDPWGVGTQDWLLMAAIVVRGQVTLGLPGWEPPRYRTR